MIISTALGMAMRKEQVVFIKEIIHLPMKIFNYGTPQIPLLIDYGKVDIHPHAQANIVEVSGNVKTFEDGGCFQAHVGWQETGLGIMTPYQ
jgi:hypothetical protein